MNEKGLDSESHAVNINNIAVLHVHGGNVDTGLPFLEHALYLQLTTLGPTSPITMLTQSNLGMAYLAGGKPEKSLPLLERSFCGRVEGLGGNHPDTLVSLINNLSAYQFLGKEKPDFINLHFNKNTSFKNILQPHTISESIHPPMGYSVTNCGSRDHYFLQLVAVTNSTFFRT